MKNYLLLNDLQVKEELGKKIRNYRIDLGWSQQDLANKSGISLHSVSNIENGKDFVINNLISVLRAFNLIDNLDSLIPDTVANPFDVAKGIMERKRVR